MESKENVKFDFKYLQNWKYPISEEEKKHFEPDEILEQENAYNEAETALMYDNLQLHWDSCDCGDGYGCNHPDWVYEITNGEEGQTIEMQDDGMCICVEHGEEPENGFRQSRDITTSDLDFSMADFERLCSIVGFKLSKINSSGNYEVVYKVAIKVYADNENEAHEKAGEELEELIKDEEQTEHYYLNCEIFANQREIRKL